MNQLRNFEDLQSVPRLFKQTLDIMRTAFPWFTPKINTSCNCCHVIWYDSKYVDRVQKDIDDIRIASTNLRVHTWYIFRATQLTYMLFYKKLFSPLRSPRFLSFCQILGHNVSLRSLTKKVTCKSKYSLENVSQNFK